jgi:glycosyltransferase involved in cell wall biosynthesis
MKRDNKNLVDNNSMSKYQEKASNLLSIVIISRNEAQNIGRCIESCMATANHFPDTNIVLVDSASTDETCSIAQEYPISIVQLKPNWRLTPAAGRFIGTTRTNSEYLLFVDGDMVLNGEWIREGIDFLRSDPKVAGVSGDLDEIYLDQDGAVIDTLNNRYQVLAIREEKSFGGVGLYRRAALDKAGTFNPFVPLREEAELALRLRRIGYTLFRLPRPIATHYSPPRTTIKEVSRRYRAGYYTGYGRALFYSFKSGVGLQFVDEQGRAYISFAIYLLIGIVSFLCLLIGGIWQPIVFWLALTAFSLIVFSLKKGGVKNALIGLVSRFLIVYGSVVGTLSAMRDPSEYPTDVIVIQP